MSWLSRLTYSALAVSCAFLSATVLLVYLYKQDMPYAFAPSMLLASTVGIVVPLLATIGFSYLAKKTSSQARFLFFCTICICLAGALSLITF